MLLAPALLLVAIAFANEGDPNIHKTGTRAKNNDWNRSSMRRSKIGIKLSQAKKEEFTPCKRCNEARRGPASAFN
jgi:hypothetical protein